MGAVNGGAQLLIDSAETLAENDEVLGVNHWLKAICTRNAGIMESLALNVDAKQLLKEVDLELQQNKPGRELPVASVVERALAQARTEGKEKAAERNIIKPALSRGEISCIAATTDDEYRRFIETDSALERRFQPIRVQEMTREQAEQVLLSLREELCRLHPVKVSDDVICRLTYLAQQYLRNRYFPDKAVDLLEQCVAHAAVNQKDAVDYDDAEEIVFRMIGMPLNVDQRLEEYA